MIGLNDSKDEKSFSKEVFSALSKEGSFKILNKVEDKLISKRGTHKELNLTKRQYYTRLRELKNLNLIEKKGNGYVKTKRGEKVDQLIETSASIGNEKELDKETSNDAPLAGPRKIGGGEPLVISDYGTLAEKVMDIMEGAEDEIAFASRYIDHRIVKACLKLSERERLNLRIVVQKFKPSQSMELLKAISSPGEFKNSLDFARSSMRVAPNLPYSFIVADRETVALEIINSFRPDVFYMALLFNSKEMGKRLLTYFEDLFEEAENTPLDSQREEVLSLFS